MAKAPSGPVVPPSDGPAVTVYGYHPYWGPEVSTLDYDRLTHLAIFGVTLESDGSLSDTSRWTSTAPEAVALAHAAGVRVHVCLIAFDSAVHQSVFSSSSRTSLLVSELAALVDDYGADGVNVDVEGLDSDLRDEFVSFITELNAAVEDVVIATPAVDWSGAFDYDRLAAQSTGLFIMGYGYHWGGGSPGPVDPLYGGSPWSEYSLSWSVEDYLYHDTPADKIILGLPTYGYEWEADHDVPGDNSDSDGDGEYEAWAVVMFRALEDVDETGEHFDTVTRSPYTLPSGTQLWYPTVESVRERIRYAVDSGVQGVGFWALGYEPDDAGFWEMVDEETRGEPDTTPTDDPPDPEDSASGADQPLDTPGVNDPPVAEAGLALVAYAGDTVELNGRGSVDPEGLSLSFEWAQIGGPPVSLVRHMTDTPSFVVPQPGTYRFELVVYDGELSSAPGVTDVVVPARSGGWGGCQTGGVGAERGGLFGLLLLMSGIGSRIRRTASPSA